MSTLDAVFSDDFDIFSEDTPTETDIDESDFESIVVGDLLASATFEDVEQGVFSDFVPAEGESRSLMSTVSGAPKVLLPRPIVLGTSGRDVVMVARALSRAGYMEWGSFTPLYGKFKREAVHEFQIDKKLTTKGKYLGYGVRTHEALRQTRPKVGTGWAFDQFGINVMAEEYARLHESPEQIIRANIISMARRIYLSRSLFPYRQSRPFPLVKLSGSLTPLRQGIDCSAYATITRYAAGAINPNVMGGTRLPWNGQGYTGTLLAGGRKCTRAELLPGDFVFYGFSRKSTPAFPYGSPTHIAIWEGKNDMVYSNGSYPMGHYNYRYRHDINCYVTSRVI